jgi:hypothetical protein
VCSYRNKIKAALAAGSLAVIVIAHPIPTDAREFTADDLMETLDDRQRYLFIAGAIAGLATARYVRDGHDEGGACIESWFYDTDGIRERIYAAFARFGDRSPVAILHAMATRECGE